MITILFDRQRILFLSTLSFYRIYYEVSYIDIENRNAYLISLILNDIKPNILTIKKIRERIRPVVEKHHIEEVYLFGSYARGEAGPDSDVDIYCSSGDIETLYGEMDLIDELEQALGKKVDLVTIGSQMHEFFRKQLEEDKIRIC